MTWDPEIEEINRRRAMAREMGGPDRVAQQHSLGKLTVRERIEKLVDSGSFMERGILGGVGTYDEEENLVDFAPKSTVFGIAKIDDIELALETCRKILLFTRNHHQFVYICIIVYTWHFETK